MKKEDLKKLLGTTTIGIIGAILMPCIGWILSGWNKFSTYIENSPEKVVIWAIVGCAIGNIISVVLEKLDGKEGKSGEDK